MEPLKSHLKLFGRPGISNPGKSCRHGKSCPLPALILAAVALCVSAFAQARIVDVKPRITNRGGPVYLEDIVMSADQLNATERKLVVVDTMVWEDGKNVSLRSIAYLLQRHPQLHELQLRGPEYVTFDRLVSPEMMARVQAAIIRELATRPPWSEWEIDVQLDASDELLLHRAGEFQDVSIKTIDVRDALGHVQMEIICMDNERKAIDTIRISPKVLRKIPVMIIGAYHPAGYVLQTDDVLQSTFWADDEKRTYIGSFEEVVGKELNRRLNAGDVITPTDLLEPKCAERGDSVWVTVIRGGLQVRITAIAEQPGRRGQRIKVQNPNSGKIYRVELTGPRTAELTLGP